MLDPLASEGGEGEGVAAGRNIRRLALDIKSGDRRCRAGDGCCDKGHRMKILPILLASSGGRHHDKRSITSDIELHFSVAFSPSQVQQTISRDVTSEGAALNGGEQFGSDDRRSGAEV